MFLDIICHCKQYTISNQCEIRFCLFRTSEVPPTSPMRSVVDAVFTHWLFLRLEKCLTFSLLKKTFTLISTATSGLTENDINETGTVCSSLTTDFLGYNPSMCKLKTDKHDLRR